MESITIPELYCPFPRRINRHVETVRGGSLDWVRRLGLVGGEKDYQKIRHSDCGGLAARFHPEAPLEGLQIVSDFYTLMFIRDDLRDDSEVVEDPGWIASLDTRYLEILEGAEPGKVAGPLEEALADLRRRLFAKAPTRTWMRRFIRSVRGHFEANAWEAQNRTLGVVPELSAYLRMRPLTNGLDTDTELIEAVEEVRLPPEVRDHPVVNRLADASNNAVCWANDIISLQKEVESGDVHNLVLVLQHSDESTLQEATESAAGMHDGEVREFVRLESQLPSFGKVVDASLGHYISTLRARVRGNLEWSHESGRYATPVRILTHDLAEAPSSFNGR